MNARILNSSRAPRVAKILRSTCEDLFVICEGSASSGATCYWIDRSASFAEIYCFVCSMAPGSVRSQMFIDLDFIYRLEIL
jgi:hypothetical protein